MFPFFMLTNNNNLYSLRHPLFLSILTLSLKYFIFWSRMKSKNCTFFRHLSFLSRFFWFDGWNQNQIMSYRLSIFFVWRKVYVGIGMHWQGKVYRKILFTLRLMCPITPIYVLMCRLKWFHHFLMSNVTMSRKKNSVDWIEGDIYWETLISSTITCTKL